MFDLRRGRCSSVGWYVKLGCMSLKCEEEDEEEEEEELGTDLSIEQDGVLADLTA
jgi:hypothetical protein